MELAIISPIAMLELSGVVDRYHMALPFGINLSEDYIRFYSDCKGYKILDNGVVEGTQYTAIELHQMANAVDAQCIVVPDKLRDGYRTVRMAQDFEVHINQELDYMGVLQGSTLAELVMCLNFYNECEWITHVGVPRHLHAMHIHQRALLIKSIKLSQKQGDYRPFKVHALGASPWIGEVAYLNEFDCDGMDTSFPVVMGMKGHKLSSPYVKRPDNFFTSDLKRSSIPWKVTKNNVREYYGFAGIKLDKSIFASLGGEEAS